MILRARSRVRGGVIGAGAIYAVGMVAQNGLSLLLLPVVTRVLGVASFGTATTCSAIATLLGMVYGLGLNFAIVRLYYDSGSDVAGAGWAALVRLQTAVASALAVATYLTGPLWARALPSLGWHLPLKLAVAYGFFLAILSTTQGVIRAARRPVPFTVLAFGQIAIGSTAGLVCARFWGVSGYLAGLSIGAAVAAAVGARLTWATPKWSWSVIVPGIALSIPALVHQLGSWGIDAADRILVAGYLGAAAVGRYQVAYVIGSILTLLLTALQSAWAPHYIGSLSDSERRTLPGRAILPVVLAVGVGAALLVLALPIIAPAVAPPRFGQEAVVTAMVASVAPIRAAYFLGIVVALDRRRTTKLAIASGVGITSNLLLNVALIPVWGLRGAALATIVSAAAQALILLKGVERLLGESLHLVKLCGAWASAVALLVTLTLVPTSGSGMIVRAFVGLVLSLGLVVWLNLRFRRQVV